MPSIRTKLALVVLLAGAGFAEDADIMSQAVAAQQSGDFDRASSLYRSLLTSRPDDLAAHSNLGVVLVKLGRYDEAIAEYGVAERLSGGDARIGVNLALALSKSGRLREAADKLEAIRGGDPTLKQVTLLLADCDLQLGADRKVIDLLEPLSRDAASDLAVAYMLGTAYLRSQRTAEGQQMLDRILRVGDSAEARFLLGTRMFESGDYPAAVQQLASAISVDPKVPGLQSLYGRALLNTGDPDGAAAAFRAELAANPNDFEANFGLAQILTVRRKTDEARPLVARAKLVRPGADVDRLVKPETSLSETALHIGDPAPDFSLPSLADGKPVTLGSYRDKSPVVLIFGSYSCPNFRDSAQALRKLAARFGSRAPFLLVYIREAHAGESWESTRNVRDGISTPQATTIAEKREHAASCKRSLHLSFPAVVDGMDGAVEKAYSAWPGLGIVVGRDGRVKYITRLTELDFREEEMASSLDAATRARGSI